MKYVLTGGAGHITKPLAEKLLKAGHTVTVIGRNADNLKDLKALGALTAIGSVEDIAFLEETFAGADAVYTMVPPNFGASEWKKWIGKIGSNYAEAIKANNVKYVVNLSSVGAHLPDGVGPVSGLHLAEQELNKSGANIKHLRPGYFFDNLLANVGLAKNMSIIGSNFGGAELKVILTSPADIAEVAAEELLNLHFNGIDVRYISSDERTTADIAKTIGTAIGKPEVPWVTFKDEDALQGMLQAGLPGEVAKNYVEMGNSIQSGKMFEDYWKHRPSQLGKTKLEDFAKVFAQVYSAS
jgi:uncharacterized protein YbjT (DUF2867 family)